MKRSRSLRQTGIWLMAFSFSLFAASAPIIVPQVYPYAILNPATPTQNDSVVMQLILGNNSNNCLSPFIGSFHIVQTSNIACLRAPCPQQYLIKIGYAPDLRPIDRMCPMIVGPYGPTYSFGVLNIGTYTVVDSTTGNDTLLSFTISEKTSPISITGTVTKWNSRILNSGPMISGAKVYLRSSNNLAGPASPTATIVAPILYYPIIDSTVTNVGGAYSFTGHASGLYMVSVSADNYQAYSTPPMSLTKDTLLNTVLLPVNATGAVSGTIASYSSCHYVNNIPLCTGLLIPLAGCTVSVTFPPLILLPLAKTSAAILPVNYTTITDNNGHYSIASIPVEYANQPITVTASKPGFNQKSASVSLITMPSDTQNFNLEASYTNSNTILKNGTSYTIATDKALYKATDSVFVRYTVVNTSTKPDTFILNYGCQYDMNAVKPPRDTVYQYLKYRACPMIVATLFILQPNQTLTMDFPGWQSDSAYDSLRISALMAGMPQTAASIDVRFEQPITGINFNTGAGAAVFKGATMAFDRLSNMLTLSVGSAQSVQLDLFGLDGRKIHSFFNKNQCGPGTYRFSINKAFAAHSCIIAKLKTSTAESVLPITLLR